MNKEQQIEEFQNDIIDNLFNGGTYKLAEALYNAGYRKLSEDSVVLSREEHEILVKTAQGKIGNMKATDLLKACISSGFMLEAVSTKEQVKQAVKEFAEKLKGKLQDFGDGGEKGAYITEKDICETTEKPVDTPKKEYPDIDGIVSEFVVKDGNILYGTNILDGYRHEFKDIHEICDELNNNMKKIDRLMELNNHLRFQLDELKGDKND